ncbi:MULTISPECIES: XdhC family protein [Janibacter]|uniref:Xanthine dehydrogenase accessory factor n=1 Tax=Janibacter indicus TaxID=857417 RepID=A0A1W2BJ18_9MICO|nr:MULTISPECIES: XdhC/CoxI family protein [Janibacter]QNF94582.1 XdhC family protein [Janibacter sp. YB324]SMC72871.1 xanthine dehydrogenase accessory factor [Janibacter indicus]
MREVLPELMQWWEQGHSVGVGTVVATFRSAPRPPGASMLVGPEGTAVGSVSGGCVEGAVYESAQEVVESGRPQFHRYGISDDDAMSVGLTCGGILDVWVEVMDRETFPELGEIAADVEAGRPVAVATVIEHPDEAWLGRRMLVRPDQEPTGTLGSARVDAAVRDDALGQLALGHNATLGYGPDGERRGEGMRVFVWAFAPPPRMLVFGAIDFAAAVARVGDFLGYRVTVCDARPVFATRTRFPAADEVVVDWPHRYLAAEEEAGRIDGRTVIAVLTHDPKFDVPLLEVALRLPEVGYIGAMGSRRTHDDREARLREVGVTDEELARLRSPIGLDLGARTPEETAISIAAEFVAERWGGSGRPLAGRAGRIHQSGGE